MGRLKPTVVLQPQAFRKDARAKHAKAIINKSIPALLTSDSRARKGVENAELITDPPPNESSPPATRNRKHNTDSPSPIERSTMEICISAIDTITAALRLYGETQRSAVGMVGILNMASPLRPGGGVLNGATSQEEFLCVRTTLYPSLRDSFYRLPDIGGIWTPDVLLFRDGSSDGNNLAKSDRRYAGVVSSAMFRFPDLDDENEFYANSSDREMVERKMRAVLRIFQSKGIDRLVLGAWGCGAYGNPVAEIAKAWKKVLLGIPGRGGNNKKISDRTMDNWDGIKQVVFAINDVNMGREFAKHFGQELIIESTAEEDIDHQAGDQDDEGMEELRRRIEDLEARLPDTKTELLQHRLQEVLAGLKVQLANGTSASDSDS